MPRDVATVDVSPEVHRMDDNFRRSDLLEEVYRRRIREHQFSQVNKAAMLPVKVPIEIRILDGIFDAGPLA